MKKRGRKKKEEPGSNGTGGLEIKAETDDKKKISFGISDPGGPTPDKRKTLSFGGLNITIHSAKKTDVAEVAKNLRFGSITADSSASAAGAATGEKIQYGKIPEKNKTIRKNKKKNKREPVRHQKS